MVKKYLNPFLGKKFDMMLLQKLRIILENASKKVPRIICRFILTIENVNLLKKKFKEAFKNSDMFLIRLQINLKLSIFFV